jgi:predicted amidohydrolase YtcJ
MKFFFIIQFSFLFIVGSLFTVIAYSSDHADVIFIHGTIITVDEQNTIAQAVAIKDGKILEVGNNTDIQKLQNENTIVVDLAGKTLTPGFIDGHSHFGLAGAKRANIAPPPVGNVTNISELVAVIQEFKEKNQIADGQWINARGYDPDQLEEQRHPSKRDLDDFFPNNPVALTHVSGHMVVANSYALKLSGIDRHTPNPGSGVIVKEPETEEPSGLLLESAAGLLKRGASKKYSREEKLNLLKDAQLLYASHGITTAQIGNTGLDFIQFLNQVSKENKLFIDIEALVSYRFVDELLNDSNYQFGVLDHHFKIAGFKLFADGSPQGKTAYFTKPYLTEVPGSRQTGVPTITQKTFDNAVIKGYKNNIQPYVHCNGDGAIDMYLHAVRQANNVLKTSSVERRSVVIHSQFVRSDQLDAYKELGIIPSFFSNHAFFWGDQHTKNLGEERAAFLSPLKSALQKGIIATNHTDYGVTPLNQLFLLWTSVSRKSRTNKIIGQDECLTPIEGLRTITINGAYQYFEENIKGSIEKGKLADFVILSENPLTVQTDKIKDIFVIETIKEGKTIFKQKENH